MRNANRGTQEILALKTRYNYGDRKLLVGIMLLKIRLHLDHMLTTLIDEQVLGFAHTRQVCQLVIHIID